MHYDYVVASGLSHAKYVVAYCAGYRSALHQIVTSISILSGTSRFAIVVKQFEFSVCPGSFMSTGAKFPVDPVESALVLCLGLSSVLRCLPQFCLGLELFASASARSRNICLGLSCAGNFSS